MKKQSLEEIIIETLKSGDSIYFDPWGSEQFRVSIRREEKKGLVSNCFKCMYQHVEEHKFDLISNLLTRVKEMFK